MTPTTYHTSIPLWASNQLLSGFSESELNEIGKHLESQTFQPGELLIRVGEVGDHLYLIESGKVAIEKDGVTLGYKSAGDHVGTMALLDKSTRSADVRAIEPTHAQSLTIEKIREISNIGEQSTFLKIVLNHLNDQQAVLRKMNDSTIEEVRQKLEEARKCISFGDFFMTVLAILLLYLFLMGTLLEWQVLRTKTYMYIIGPSFIGIFGFIAYNYVRKSNYTFEHFGLSFKNWKTHVRQATLWSLGFVAVVTILKWLAIQLVPAYAGAPVFDFHRFYQDNWMTLVLIKVLYVLFAPIQELIVRGILQGGMQHFLSGKGAVTRSIILSNLIFACGHIPANLWFAVLTFIPGLFWGWMYAKQGTLVGVSLSHILIGLYASLLLGIF